MNGCATTVAASRGRAATASVAVACVAAAVATIVGGARAQSPGSTTTPAPQVARAPAPGYRIVRKPVVYETYERPGHGKTSVFDIGVRLNRPLPSYAREHPGDSLLVLQTLDGSDEAVPGVDPNDPATGPLIDPSSPECGPTPDGIDARCADQIELDPDAGSTISVGARARHCYAVRTVSADPSGPFARTRTGDLVRVLVTFGRDDVSVNPRAVARVARTVRSTPNDDGSDARFRRSVARALHC